MSGDFLDTNNFVYVLSPGEPRKQAIAIAVVTEALFAGSSISYQVVQETLNVIVGRAPRLATNQDALDFLDDVLTPLCHVDPSPALFRRAIALRDRYQFHFYDALIVAAALQAECTRLLSEDFQHGRRIEGLEVVNPYV